MLVVCVCSAQACRAERRVSPWGERSGPSLGAFVVRPDLERHVRSIEDESRAEGLHLVSKSAVRGKSGALFEVRGFEGRDRLGRRTTAVRVASSWGVVLAVGPLGEGDARSRPTELLPALEADAGASVRLPADLTGDGEPEIALRSELGDVAIMALATHGAGEMKIDLPDPPTALRALDAGYALLSTKRIEVAGIQLELERVATFDDGKFTQASARARAWHREEEKRRAVAPEQEGAAARAARLLEQAFHAARAESTPGGKRTLRGVDDVELPAELRTAWNEAREIVAREVSR